MPQTVKEMIALADAEVPRITHAEAKAMIADGALAK